jgi:hypothetical protein
LVYYALVQLIQAVQSISVSLVKTKGMEWNQKVVRLTGMWLSSLVGAVYGLLFTIIGAGLDWGPGGGMSGPYWKIILVGGISLLVGMYAGEFSVRKLTSLAKVFEKPRKKTEVALAMFLVCSFASLIAWILSWEAGFISGILMGSIQWDDILIWGKIISDVALMSFIFGLPFYIIAGMINAIVALIVLKK